MEQVAEKIPNQAYTIFCSAFRYHEKNSRTAEPECLIPWQAHVFQDNKPNTSYDDLSAIKSKELAADFRDYFYASFADCLMGKSFSLPGSLLPAYTCPVKQNLTARSHELEVSYADYFLFPNNIGIVAFKVVFDQKSFDDITLLINTIRSMDHSEMLFSRKNLPFVVEEALMNGNKFKSFTVIEHDLDFSPDYTSDQLLFDLATCSPVGAAVGKGKLPVLQPSQQYFDEIIQNNKISVFENWSALALFDTFTVLHKGSLYNYNWETKYFRFIYVLTLYTKNYLIELNRIFHDPADHNVYENDFYTFDRNFNFDQISYNFLPQFIYEQIRKSLNLDKESEKLKTAIDRDTAVKDKIHKAREEESEKRINTALLIVAFLAIVSAVWDGSEWAASVFGVERSMLYSALSGAFMVIIVITIVVLLRRKYGKAK